MRDARTLAASHANKESAHAKLNPHVDWPEKLHVKVLPLDTSRDRLEQWCAFDLTDMGKGGCQGERKSGLRAFALGRSGLGLRQKSLKRLQSVREDLSALRALWLSPRRLRNSKNHAHRLNSFYTKQANTCTYSAAA